MLKVIEKETGYDILVESSGKLIGHFVIEVDGFYYFMFSEGSQTGLISDWFLIELGEKLKEINKPWSDHLDEYFSKDHYEPYGDDLSESF